MFASAEPERQLSEVLVHLGTLLAQRERGDILLVDGFSDASYLSNLFERAGDDGFVDLANGRNTWREFILPTSTPGLKLLPSGPGKVDDREAAGRVVSKLTAEFKKPFRFTLIDAGPANEAFAKMAGRCCDAAYLVVQLGKTNTEQARQALGELHRNGSRVLGCVVTNCV